MAILLQLDHQMRIIRIGGAHPAHVVPSWYGDSIGHWEGGTLIIDTIGFNTRTELQEWPGGFPHTDKMHTIERYKVSPDGKSMSADWTYLDTGALTGPFKTASMMLRSEPYQEFVNAEHNVEFPCPTAEAGSPYQPLTLRNVESQLQTVRATPAAQSPPGAR